MAEPSESPGTPGAPGALARRLRDLREHRWPGTLVPQRLIAEAFGLSLPSISAWENETKTTLPPQARLHEYATFFATRRSVDGGHGRLLAETELTAGERAQRDALHNELVGLRANGTGPVPVSIAMRFDWKYPKGAKVRIICGKLDPQEGVPGPERRDGEVRYPFPFQNEDNLNYSDLLTVADPDALNELFGHLRKVNPDADIRYIRADRLAADPQSADQTASHLILLGGIGLNEFTDQVLGEFDLPVGQRPDDLGRGEGEIFVVDGHRPEKFGPTFKDDDSLEADVAMLARTSNPYNQSTTLTICNGVYSRGVYGAVRALTDDEFRAANVNYLARRFAGSNKFVLLMRVPLLLGAVQTPDLRKETIRLYEWPKVDLPARQAAR